MNKIELFAGSGFLTGYVPFASGTFGSIAAFLLYLIPGFENLFFLIPLILITFLWGKYLGDKFELLYGKDPAECTIDELVGSWISLILVPKSLWILLVTFAVWRFMDIVKPFPANAAEKLNGGWGIMTDDVISGIYTLIFIHFMLYFF